MGKCQQRIVLELSRRNCGARTGNGGVFSGVFGLRSSIARGAPVPRALSTTILNDSWLAARHSNCVSKPHKSGLTNLLGSSFLFKRYSIRPSNSLQRPNYARNSHRQVETCSKAGRAIENCESGCTRPGLPSQRGGSAQ